MKKVVLIALFILVVSGIYFILTNKESPSTDIIESKTKKNFEYKPAKFRPNTLFYCMTKSKEVAKLYFDTINRRIEFNNRLYVTHINGGIQPELNYYVTSDHYTNPNQLYMEVEIGGGSIRITGDSIVPQGVIYYCFEVD